jgi:beta-lactamase regulating signal transducer with metallopeptidase domain
VTALPFYDLARLLSERMLNGVLAGVLIAFFAWALLRVMRQKNSGTRFAVWFAALVAIAALPFMGRFAGNGELENAFSAGPAVALPSSCAISIFLVWAVMATIGLLRLGLALWKLRQLRASAVALELNTLDPVLRKTLEEFQSFRRVTLCVSDRQAVPAAIGFFRPLIVMPSWAMREVPAAELNSILIHELAHLRRWDDWTNLFQKILRAVFFFHPAIWWVESRLSLEREMACDDIVLSRTASPRAYAQCLVSLAEKSFLRRSLVMAQAAVSRMCHTSRRVARILDSDRSAATRVWKPALGLVATFALVCGVSQSWTPKLVAFRDGGTALVMGSASETRKPTLQNVAWNVQPIAPTLTSARKTLSARPAEKVAQSTAAVNAVKPKLNSPLQLPVIQASMLENSAAAQTMLVVFQSRQYGPSGQVQWMVWVWRVNFQTPVAPRVEARVSSKQT